MSNADPAHSDCWKTCFIGAEMLKAIDDMIAKDARVLDRGEFADGTGRRDPYEKGITQGMKMARQVAAQVLEEWA